VVGDDRSAALADDVRVRNLLGVADVRNVIDDVVGVFLERVVGGAVKRRPAAVIIHPQAAADVQILDVEPHLVQFGVEARGFLHGLLNDEDVRHLRADVEMQQPETVRQVFRLSNSAAASNSAVLRPNLAFSPPLSAHLPPPRLSSRVRMPMSGSTPNCLEMLMICRSSSSFSTTMMTFLFSFVPSRAVRMKLASL